MTRSSVPQGPAFERQTLKIVERVLSPNGRGLGVHGRRAPGRSLNIFGCKFQILESVLGVHGCGVYGRVVTIF